MHETILGDFDEILRDDLNAAVLTLSAGGESYSVRAMIEPVRFSADAVPGGVRPRAAFSATVKRNDLKRLPSWGSLITFDGKSYSVLNVTHSPVTPLVTIDFCER